MGTPGLASPIEGLLSLAFIKSPRVLLAVDSDRGSSKLSLYKDFTSPLSSGLGLASPGVLGLAILDKQLYMYYRNPISLK